jgi:hypothetical protein
MAAKLGDEPTREASFAAMPDVARIGAQVLFAWIVDSVMPADGQALKQMKGYETLQNATAPTEAARLIADHRLPWETVPTELRSTDTGMGRSKDASVLHEQVGNAGDGRRSTAAMEEQEGGVPGASLHRLAQLTFQIDQSFGTLAARMADRGLIERVSGPGRAARDFRRPPSLAAQLSWKPAPDAWRSISQEPTLNIGPPSVLPSCRGGWFRA